MVPYSISDFLADPKNDARVFAALGLTSCVSSALFALGYLLQRLAR